MGSRLSVIMTLTVGNMICESPQFGLSSVNSVAAYCILKSFSVGSTSIFVASFLFLELFTHLLQNSQCEQTIMLQALSYYHVYDKVC